MLTLAILASIGFAFAGRPRAFQTLYYYNGSQYLPVGILGENYICEASTNVCTYSYSNGNYVPHDINSTYVPVMLSVPAAKSSK